MPSLKAMKSSSSLSQIAIERTRISFLEPRSDDSPSLGASVPTVRLKVAILPLPFTGTRQ